MNLLNYLQFVCKPTTYECASPQLIGVYHLLYGCTKDPLETTNIMGLGFGNDLIIIFLICYNHQIIN